MRAKTCVVTGSSTGLGRGIAKPLGEEGFNAVINFKAVDDGRIINISRVIGKQGNIGQANYTGAKSGLFGFTRSLALELADTDVTANCIAPGFTCTEMVEAIPDEIQDDLRAEIPLERFADISEIAGLVRYLASEQSGYMTGEVIDVNGGIDL